VRTCHHGPFRLIKLLMSTDDHVPHGTAPVEPILRILSCSLGSIVSNVY
jgi:hypothetical protein